MTNKKWILFYILVIWESIGFMWKINFGTFIKSLRFETLWVRKNGIYESVCPSVVVGLLNRKKSLCTKCNSKSLMLQFRHALCYKSKKYICYKNLQNLFQTNIVRHVKSILLFKRSFFSTHSNKWQFINHYTALSGRYYVSITLKNKIIVSTLIHLNSKCTTES